MQELLLISEQNQSEQKWNFLVQMVNQKIEKKNSDLDNFLESEQLVDLSTIQYNNENKADKYEWYGYIFFQWN